MADIPLPRYNLPNAGLPPGIDVASSTAPVPLAGLTNGLQSGFGLGFQARQVAALEQERKTQAMAAHLKAVADMSKQKEDKFKYGAEKVKAIGDHMSTSYFKNLDQETQNKTHSAYVNELNSTFGTSYDPNEPYHASDSEAAKDLSAILGDKSLNKDDRIRIVQSRLLRAQQEGVPKDYLDELRKNSGVGGESSVGQESSQYVAVQDNQGVIWNPKSKTFELKPFPGTGTVIPKAEPAKIAEQQIGNTEAIGLIDGIEETLKGTSGISGATKMAASKLTAGAISPEIRIYQQQKPAIAVKLYRALTNDTRLSDADAAARAMPLLPDPYEDPKVQLGKLKSLRDASSGRNDSLQSILTGTPAPKPAGWSSDKEKRYQEWKAKQK